MSDAIEQYEEALSEAEALVRQLGRLLERLHREPGNWTESGEEAVAAYHAWARDNSWSAPG